MIPDEILQTRIRKLLEDFTLICSATIWQPMAQSTIRKLTPDLRNSLMLRIGEENGRMFTNICANIHQSLNHFIQG